MITEKIDPALLRVLNEAATSQSGDWRLPVFVTVAPERITQQDQQEAHSLGLRLELNGRRLLAAELGLSALRSLSDKPWCVYLEPDQTLPPPNDPGGNNSGS